MFKNTRNDIKELITWSAENQVKRILKRSLFSKLWGFFFATLVLIRGIYLDEFFFIIIPIVIFIVLIIREIETYGFTLLLNKQNTHKNDEIA